MAPHCCGEEKKHQLQQQQQQQQQFCKCEEIKIPLRQQVTDIAIVRREFWEGNLLKEGKCHKGKIKSTENIHLSFEF